jgi:hypothetical protein
MTNVVRCGAALIIASLAQVIDAQPSRTPTQTLLRRLAEAVDGNRAPGDVFVVASYDSLNPVAGVFRTRADAEAMVRRLGAPSWDVFGPYHSDLAPVGCIPRDPRSDSCGDEPVTECVHDGYRSVMDRLVLQVSPICPPDASVFRGIRQRSIDSITVTLHVRGDSRSLHLPGSIDAIFLTMPALDKFAFPYYSRIIGMDATSDLRRRIAATVNR